MVGHVISLHYTTVFFTTSHTSSSSLINLIIFLLILMTFSITALLPGLIIYVMKLFLLVVWVKGRGDCGDGQGASVFLLFCTCFFMTLHLSGGSYAEFVGGSGGGAIMCSHGAIRFIAMTTRCYTCVRRSSKHEQGSFISAVLGLLPLLCLGTSLLSRIRKRSSFFPRAFISRRSCRFVHLSLNGIVKARSSCLSFYGRSMQFDSRPTVGAVSRSLTSICRTIGGFIRTCHVNLSRGVCRTIIRIRGTFELC